MTALPGIGPQLGRLFERLAGPLVVDLLWHLPIGHHRPPRRAADNRASKPTSVATLQVRVEAHQPGMGRRPYRVLCVDDTGILTLVYFNVKSDYLARLFPIGAERIVSGRVEFYNGIAQMPHPDLVLRPDEARPAEADRAGLSADRGPAAARRAARRRGGARAGARAAGMDRPRPDSASGSGRAGPKRLRQAHAPASEADLSPTDPARAAPRL